MDIQEYTGSYLTILSGSFIKSIKVTGYSESNGKCYYILTVEGRSQFLYNFCKSTVYKFVTTYTALRQLHKDLSKELVEIKSNSTVNFPGISMLSSERSEAKKLSLELNKYFSSLYNKFPKALLCSQSLLNFFEPTHVNFHLVGFEQTQRDKFTSTLIGLLGNMNGEDVREASCFSECAPKSPTGRAKPPVTVQNYLPFDYKYKYRMFRVDIFPKEEEAVSTVQESYKLCCCMDNKHSAALLGFTVGDVAGYKKAKEILGHIKLFALDGRYTVPSLAVIGITSGETTKKPEMNAYLAKLFEDSSKYKYIEANLETGEGILEALDKAFDCIINRSR